MVEPLAALIVSLKLLPMILENEPIPPFVSIETRSTPGALGFTLCTVPSDLFRSKFSPKLEREKSRVLF